MSKPAAYVIKGAAEETACPRCGFPLYAGDTAYELGDDAGYCCEECAIADAYDVQEPPEADDTPRVYCLGCGRELDPFESACCDGYGVTGNPA